MTSFPATRILFFIYSLGAGGAERVTVNLANYWAASGRDITIVTLAGGELDFYELHPAVRRISLNLAGASHGSASGLWQNLRRIAALRRVLWRARPDIALGMMTTASVLLAVAALGLPICALGSEHIHPPQLPLSPLWKRLRSLTYGSLEAVAALTPEAAAWLHANTRVRRVVVIPNAVPWPLPVHPPVVAPAGVCKPGRQILLGVGRLEAEKGFDLLLGAFAQLAPAHPEWDLVILGEGSLRQELEDQAQGAVPQGRVFLPGRVGNLADWFQRAALYAMSSRFEGFGNTLAEALAHGIPAVSYDCDSGPRHIIRHEIDGLLVPSLDVPGLATALERLMDDSALRRRFATRATEARDRFSLPLVANLWERLFEETLLEQDRK
jgi:glycosyltransferase involved in cell wall biosynthesis